MKLGLGEKVKVFELGSGSGQHAVEVCSRHREVLWQPSDISKLCISSIDARAKQYDVFKSPVNARYMHGNCHEALNFDITMYDKTIALLENKWKSVDLLVALNVVQYAPWRFVENLFKLGNEICKMYGFIFLYGPFRVDGNITHDQQMLELHLKTLSAKFGIRDLEDVIEIAASYQFHLEVSSCYYLLLSILSSFVRVAHSLVLSLPSSLTYTTPHHSSSLNWRGTI